MGTGGSRYGAGRPGWRRKCEYSLPFDIRRINRKGLLNAGNYFGWNWSRGDERIANIGVTVATDDVTLRYTWTPYGHDPMSIECRITLACTPCNYGGTRLWFTCPDCDRRCAVLYGVSRFGNFACRVCERLAYASEAESQLDRLWRKQRKIEARLIDGEIKPKGMRWQTYNGLIDRINVIEEQKDVHFFARLAPLILRTGMRADDLFR